MERFLFLSLFFVFLLVSCQQNSLSINEREFKILMNNIAEGWSTLNTELALSSFDEDAIYMEPPNIQYYRGHEQLRPYFNALDQRHHMQFHHLWFDEASQTGAGEYTFSYGQNISDVGIAVVELRNGKIWFWREYQRKGPTNFKEFVGVENKKWDWHIGNYPEPKDAANEN